MRYKSPLDRLANHDCERCELHETTERVCVMGRGSADAKILILGEAPGGNEERTGKVFSGAAGKLLDEALAAAGIPQESVYISNVVKCRPPENRRPGRAEWEACARYLRREIRALHPDHVLLLGNTALEAVWGRSGITKHRGVRLPESKRFPELRGTSLMASIHPAYCLRNPGQTPLFFEDVKRFSRLAAGTLEVQEVRARFAATEGAVQYVAQRIKQAEVVAYDVENRYSPWHPDWKILCLGVSITPDEAFVIPLWHPDSVFRKKWKRILRKYIAPAFKYTTAKLIAQNGKHDNVQLAGADVYVEHHFDIMLAAHLLDENRPKNLGFLAQTLLGADVYKGMLDLKPDKIAQVDLRQLCTYNAHDCGYTHQLYPKLRAELKEHPRLWRLMAKLMMPASHTIQRVEYRGMYVNRARLLERMDRLQYMIDEQMGVIHEHLPKNLRDDFNPNSPQQLGRWLFGSTARGGLGLNPLERTRTGMPSTREGVLLHYREHPVVGAILRYRTLQLKWMNTYLLPWSERIDARSRLHTVYKLYGTVTGRLSGDLQQVPRNPFIRSVFGAPDGWVWIQADYSQIELRIAAHIAGERRMVRAFLTGEDLHAITASRLTGRDPAEYAAENVAFALKEERKLAKAVNFGFLYDMYPAKFRSYAFENYGLQLTMEEAELARKQYFETFADLRSWHDRQRRLVHSRGWVQSPLGRVRHLPDIHSSDGGVVREAERQAINSPVQATASDCMLFGMVQLDRVLDPRECFMVGTLHDGIFFECREERAEHWAGVIKETLENLPLKRTFGCELQVPIVADVEWGQHWGEAEHKI